MSITHGCLDDILDVLFLFKKNIPEKKNLTENEVINRLQNRPHGVIISKEENTINGMYIWYEEQDSLYLWLGVVRQPGSGLGRKLLNYMEVHSEYSRWFVKTHRDNAQALALLSKTGFKEYKQKGNIVYLERFFDSKYDSS